MAQVIVGTVGVGVGVGVVGAGDVASNQDRKPWNIGEFYGQSYFCDPRGQMLSVGTRDKDAIITADMDFDEILEVRKTWQFFPDRRPETYGELVQQLP